MHCLSKEEGNVCLCVCTCVLGRYIYGAAHMGEGRAPLSDLTLTQRSEVTLHLLQSAYKLKKEAMHTSVLKQRCW